MVYHILPFFSAVKPWSTPSASNSRRTGSADTFFFRTSLTESKLWVPLVSLLLENLFIPGIRNTRQFLAVLTSFGYSECQSFASKQGQTASQKISFDLVLLLKSPVKNLIISSEPSDEQSFL